MAVNDTHPQYDAYRDEWQKARDVFDGQRSVHNQEEKYLPRLGDQTNSEYEAYKNRALFYEATSRTVQGLKGMIFRKPPNIVLGGMSDFINDVTLSGQSLEEFASDIVEEAILVGRGGILIDHPRVDEDDMTQAQAQSLGLRPFLKLYKAEAITFWESGKELTQVRLRETVRVRKSEFEFDEKEQIRVLDIDGGTYRQRVFEKLEDQKGKVAWAMVDEIVPIMNGKTLDFIPFVFVAPDGDGAEVTRPPLTGMVNTNLSHYRTTADLEHGAHFTGLPTPVISGHSLGEKDEPFRIGSTTAWLFPDPQAEAKYLEFTGQGLESLRKLIEAKEQQMAALGAQMLTPEARRNEAAETAGIRHMGENSVLSGISQAISKVLNKCLTIAGEWMSVVPAEIELNRDFMPQEMTPQMLQQLVASWQSGAISANTLFENLKAGEIIDSKKEFDDEQAEIQTTATVL